ncbi:hypothetical protein M942_05990 [Enterobacter ludwigii]|jgi:hypothetical protein|uniref:hypothetical protein n=1 Tax=Enterobacter ludwigii TaxID=299767 RepID=UPI0003D8507C|nr:hypothetical protein [Enterobacter ludwigii]AHE72691.1 hypothetical protein M942_05990 [Enterobacter ludwigii]
MPKTFTITGYAVNRRGHTVGIHHTVTATSADAAQTEALRRAAADGHKHIRITLVQEVGNV